MTNNIEVNNQQQLYDLAKGFVSNIVCIDDKAYHFKDREQMETYQEIFPSSEISKAFAIEEKICGIYSPDSTDYGTEAMNTYYSLSANADIVVIDWNIPVEGHYEAAKDTDDEADADTQDTRGIFACDIIKQLVVNHDLGSKTKVVLIYTGESGLKRPLERIKASVESGKSEMVNSDECYSVKQKSVDDLEFMYGHTLIIIRQKDVNPDISDHEKKDFERAACCFEQLPKLLISKYGGLLDGILLNTSVKSLTQVRKNAQKVLSCFNNTNDMAFVNHCLCLKDIDNDSLTVFHEVFGEMMTSFIENIDFDIKDQIVKWGRVKYKAEFEKTLDAEPSKRKQAFFDEQPKKCRDNIKRKKLDRGHRVDQYLSAYLPDRQAEIEKNMLESSTSFSVLNRMKNFFDINSRKKLEMGTIIMEEKSNLHYVCIQPVCDSVRIKAPRDFIFLPLKSTTNDGSFDVVFDDKSRYDILSKSYNICSFSFNADSSLAVKSKLNGFGKAIFEDESGNTYVWKHQLRRLHAQRIADNYSKALSRIGLNEDEWSRLHGEKED